MSARVPVVMLLLAVWLAGACGDSPPDERKGPFLDAKWSGSDSGKIGGPATAEWCDSLHLLEIRAVRGDTGIALALYPAGPFRPGTYPVKPPATADSAPPGAAVGLRWFAETSMRGFQGDSGSVAVRESPPGVYAGEIEAHARSVTDGSHITVHGSFGRLTVHQGGRGCVARKASRDSSGGVN